MTIRFDRLPDKTQRTPTKVFMTAEVPVAELSFERGRFAIHYHGIAGALNAADRAALAAAAAVELNKLNAPLAVADRLKGTSPDASWPF